MAAVMFDLDNFKQINDTCGHEAGDRVLQAVTQACRAGLRSADTLFRLGGDEFAIVMGEVDMERAVLVADRLRTDVSALVVTSANGPCKVTASFGVAGFTGGEESLDDLLARADKALYVAKSHGRNRVDVAPPA
jgi:diguanylate cyclase (GGDEF)-like protein